MVIEPDSGRLSVRRRGLTGKGQRETPGMVGMFYICSEVVYRSAKLIKLRT